MASGEAFSSAEQRLISGGIFGIFVVGHAHSIYHGDSHR